MKKRALPLVALFLALLLLFGGCAAFSHYEDTNGDQDYTLQTLTDENIMKGTGGSLSSVSLRTSSITPSKSKVTLKVGKFSGVSTLESFRGGSSYRTVTVSLTVSAGNFKAVLCTDSEILYVFPINQTGSSYSFKKEQTVYLRIAGESAKYELTYEY